jgi:hypothetical protein
MIAPSYSMVSPVELTDGGAGGEDGCGAESYDDRKKYWPA